ncbi:MAG: caspase family protein [Candidatus Heimdallarchaeota archaeon]|nr:caspase family protein [Candidatus Heimdallarchaeota archaeon]
MNRKLLALLIFGIFLASSFSIAAAQPDLTERVKPDGVGKPPKDDGDDGSGGSEITGNKLALVIGISDYEGTDSDLQYADDDARDWANYLRGQGYSVTTLIDAQATANNILNAFQDLADAEVAGDGIVITYSGHGYYDRSIRESMFISQDLYGVPASYIKAITDTFDSTHVAFFDDACNQGTFNTLAQSGWLMAIGSQKNTYTYDGFADMSNGIFTWYALEALEDLGMIIMEDVFNYAISMFEADTPGNAFLVDDYTGDFYL